MRYYSIEINDVATPDKSPPERIYTSFIRTGNNAGVSLAGALNVEMDILVAPFAIPYNNSFVRIWGIGIKDISQASDLNGKSIKVFGGMQKGLPLANPKQSGLLCQGIIQQAFGNWQGTNQSLDLVIMADTGAADNPKNLPFNWKKGTPLSQAIRNTLSTGFPGYKLTININENLVLAADEPGYYQSLVQFARYIKNISTNIIGGEYSGVDIRLQQNELIVYDNSTEKAPYDISFQDLIGQPTWIQPQMIQFSCVMRADIVVGDFIRMPKGKATITAQSLSQFHMSSIFQGTFRVTEIRHVGNFRQPDGASWVTIINASLIPVT